MEGIQEGSELANEKNTVLALTFIFTLHHMHIKSKQLFTVNEKKKHM